MEYPNLPERKLIDIPANSRASRGTCKIITTRWSETKPSKLAPQCASTFIWMKRPQTIWSSAFIWTKISSTYVSFHSRYNRSPNKKSSRYNGTAKKQLNPCLSLSTIITCQIKKKEQFICDIVTNDDRIKEHPALA